MSGKIIINVERCKACLLCVEVCKAKRLEPGSTLNKAGYVPVVQADDVACKACTQCALRCPEVAIEVYLDEES